jgi:hypothetical protein
MGVEEQKEEREVLESIFPDEITGICQSQSHTLVKMLVVLAFTILLRM